MMLNYPCRATGQGPYWKIDNGRGKAPRGRRVGCGTSNPLQRDATDERQARIRHGRGAGRAERGVGRPGPRPLDPQVQVELRRGHGLGQRD